MRGMLARWLRAVIWRADDWRAALRGELESVRADAARALELGDALAHVEPDRSHALAAYAAAWDAGSAAALAPLRLIAREIGAPALLGRIAADRRTRDPELMIEAANAWIDAGEPMRAVWPLTAAAGEALTPAMAARVASMREAIEVGLAEPARDIGRWFDRAIAADSAADAAHAIRLARVAEAPDDVRARVLRAAIDRWPADVAIGALVEDHLLGRADPDELLTFYRRRLAAITPGRGWIDEIRAAATRLCVRGLAPGLGLRLMRRGLEEAYASRIGDVPGHLASWSVLVEHARRVHATGELMGLAVQGLHLDLPDDDRLWLARLGLEVSWRDARDIEVATSYAAIIIELAPDHPEVREFVDAQDVHIDLDDAAPAPEIAEEMVMSLVYLDQFESAAELIDTSRGRLTGLGVLRESAPNIPLPPLPPVAPEVVEELTLEPEPVTAPVPPVVVAPTPPSPAALIPPAALSALRRISARVRAPTRPGPQGGPRDRAARVVVPIDVTIELDDGALVKAVVRDVSTTGLFVFVDAAFEIGAEVTVTIGVPARGDALAASTHRAWARVARRGEDGYGLELLDPEPELVEALATLTGDPA